MFNDVFSFFYDNMEDIKCKASPILQTAFFSMYFFKMLENPNIKKKMEPVIYGRLDRPIKRRMANNDQKKDFRCDLRREDDLV